MELRSTEKEIQTIVSIYDRLSKESVSAKDVLPPLSFVASTTASSDGEGENDPTEPPHNAVDSNPVDAIRTLELLESVQLRLTALQSKMDRFEKRLTEKDPVSGTPRYGENTAKRVREILFKYKELISLIDSIFGKSQEGEAADVRTTEVLEQVRNSAKEQAKELARVKFEQQLLLKQHEAERIAAEEKIAAEKEKAAEESRLQLEREQAELARRAEEARLAQRASERAAAQADRDWANRVIKGVDGVKEQLAILVRATEDDPVAQYTAITALHTMFSQIVARPEETNFRRVRRDHERFNEDVGRHAGGKEILLAAGFELGVIDEIPSFISKEPNLEKDMDGWSNWFDLLKATLEVLKEQKVKINNVNKKSS